MDIYSSESIFKMVCVIVYSALFEANTKTGVISYILLHNIQFLGKYICLSSPTIAR